MNELPQRLRRLADTLDQHASSFEGTAWNRAVSGFAKSLGRFEGTVGDSVQSQAPGWRDLVRLFESPDKKHLGEEEMKHLFKKVLDHKAPKDATPAALRKAFLTALKKDGSVKKALALTEEIIADARAPKTKPPKDKESLQRELYRLGGLEDEQLAYELKKRFPDASDLRHLAKAAGLHLSKDAKKPALIRELTLMARRVHGHVLV